MAKLINKFQPGNSFEVINDKDDELWYNLSTSRQREAQNWINSHPGSSIKDWYALQNNISKGNQNLINLFIGEDSEQKKSWVENKIKESGIDRDTARRLYDEKVAYNERSRNKIQKRKEETAQSLSLYQKQHSKPKPIYETGEPGIKPLNPEFAALTLVSQPAKQLIKPALEYMAYHPVETFG